MPRIRLESLIDGDVLENDLYVEGVFLFGAGTVLNQKRLEILKSLNVPFAEVEKRTRTYGTQNDVFAVIDKRFSYVEKSPLMNRIKSWIKDALTSTGGVHD
jgi:hypothetical protein